MRNVRQKQRLPLKAALWTKKMPPGRGSSHKICYDNNLSTQLSTSTLCNPWAHSWGQTLIKIFKWSYKFPSQHEDNTTKNGWQTSANTEQICHPAKAAASMCLFCGFDLMTEKHMQRYIKARSQVNPLQLFHVGQQHPIKSSHSSPLLQPPRKGLWRWFISRLFFTSVMRKVETFSVQTHILRHMFHVTSEKWYCNVFVFFICI